MTLQRLHRLDLSLTLRAPFLIAGTERLVWGIDVFQIRNAQGLPILPDTHLKGLLSHAWRTQHGQPDEGLFGKDGANDANTEKTGRLILSDLVAHAAAKARVSSAVPSRTRVKISDATGAAERGHLLTVEETAPPNTEVTFTGTALLWAEDADTARAEARMLQEAFALVAAVGRFKTVGYGEVVSFSATWTGEETGLGTHPGAARFALDFTLSKPALIAARILDRNTLESGDRIPGGVIKGALAQHLSRMGHDPRAGELAAALTALRIGEAAPQEQPASRAFDEVQFGHGEGSTWRRWRADMAVAAEPLQFDPDVKDSGDPDPTLDYEMRTRLSINPDTQAAKETALFSQRLLRPQDRTGTPVIWRTTVDSSACPAATPAEKAALDLVLRALTGGPATLGKTNARMVDLKVQPAAAPSFSHPGKVRIRLETAALMLREHHLATPDTYQNAVRAYWEHVTQGAYTLAMEDAPEGWPQIPAIFARLSYRGGFEARSFHAFGTDWLEPFVLTDARSVFILEPKGKEPARPDRIAALVASGLPLVDWSGDTPKTSTLTWADCPFTPENGYGAITAEAAT